jgi:curved DNA-binding protein CbpA
MSYYDTLGVPKDASQSEIKKAFKRLASRLHPDKNPDDPDTAGQFNDARLAYETLADEEARDYYDCTGRPKGFQDKVEAKAQEILAQMFLNIVEAHEFVRMDYVAKATEIIAEQEAEARVRLKKVERDMERLAYLLDNLKGGDWTFKDGLNFRYQQMSGAIDESREMQEVIDVIKAKLAACSYTGGDAPPTQPFYQGTQFYTSSSGA